MGRVALRFEHVACDTDADTADDAATADAAATADDGSSALSYLLARSESESELLSSDEATLVLDGAVVSFARDRHYAGLRPRPRSSLAPQMRLSEDERAEEEQMEWTDGMIFVRAAGAKGLGAFAVSNIREGTRVCAYEGERLSGAQVAERYPESASSEYLFELRPKRAGVSDGVYLDANNTKHASRYINHAEVGTLMPVVSAAAAGASTTSLRWDGPVLRLRRSSSLPAEAASEAAGGECIEFYAARDIGAGEELTFDYGESYWVDRDSDPLPGSDSRVSRIRAKRALKRIAKPLQMLRWGLPL